MRDFDHHIENGDFQFLAKHNAGEISFHVQVPGGTLIIQPNEQGELEALPDDFQCEPEFIEHIITSIESYYL